MNIRRKSAMTTPRPGRCRGTTRVRHGLLARVAHNIGLLDIKPSRGPRHAPCHSRYRWRSFGALSRLIVDDSSRTLPVKCQLNALHVTSSPLLRRSLRPPQNDALLAVITPPIGRSISASPRLEYCMVAPSPRAPLSRHSSDNPTPDRIVRSTQARP